MAVGDTIVEFTSVADDGFLDIQPSGTIEWVIHNITCAATTEIEIYFGDGGANDTLVLANTGGYMECHLHNTNANFYSVKNVSGGAAYIGYDGIITGV